MSYRLDIDEMTETTLAEELGRRLEMQAAGLCDYCGRAPTTEPCKFPERHAASGTPWRLIVIRQDRLSFEVDGAAKVIVRTQRRPSAADISAHIEGCKDCQALATEDEVIAHMKMG